MLAVGMQALMVALLPWVVEMLGLGFYAGLITGCLALLAQAPLFPAWECQTAALLAVVLTGLVATLVRKGESKAREAGVAVLWGMLLLVTPAVLGVFAAWLVFRCRANRGALILAAGIPALLLAPWVARNFAQFGTFVMLRDNLGLELYVSNNPCAVFGLKGNIATGCHQKTHPNVNVDEAKRIVEWGEPDYNSRRLRDAVEWMAANPARFAGLTMQRVARFWFPADGDSRQYELLV
ncbi:MAG: hypothetical protein ABI995_03215, partial [Acidobacteriota bacterium]